MTAVVAVTSRDSSARRLAYFQALAESVAAELDADGPVPLSTGADLCELADYHHDGSVDHLVILCHGGTSWLLSSSRGVAVARTNDGPDQVTVEELAAAWAPALAATCRISLCACLCSRSPTWWLEALARRRELGKGEIMALLSPWGPRAYQRGGEASFSARLRDWLAFEGRVASVRGHRTAGDALGNPILMEHSWPAASQGIPLCELALPDEQPTAALRRWWARRGGVVSGPRARRWLLFDDLAVDEIAAAWESQG